MNSWTTYRFFLKLFLSAVTVALALTGSVQASYLFARGGKLYNESNQPVRLTGVNWFGFETSNFGPHGLWTRDYHGVLLQIKGMGFNCIRLPFCDAMLRDGAKVQSINFHGTDPFYPRGITELNKELTGLSPLQMMDEILTYAGSLGLVVILDNHSRDHDGYMNEKLWYTASCSEQQWIDDWVMLAGRYKNRPAVVGMDLDNEPHGKPSDGGSTWDAGNAASDWNAAAQKCGNAILAVNSNVLIVVEGVEHYAATTYWWGGNLRGVKTAPITLVRQDKLVYSAHEYGPEVFQQDWFNDAGFPSNMTGIWDDAFGFIVKNNLAPLFVGEFGINNSASYSGKEGKWFTALLKYLTDNFCSWTFWCFNPNSGDTGGLLLYDWLTPEQWKVDALKPLCAPLINGATNEKPATRRSPDSLNSIGLMEMESNHLRCSGAGATRYAIELLTLNGQVVQSSNNAPLAIAKTATGAFIVRLSVLGADGAMRRQGQVIMCR
jgi:endoglucanase